MEKLLERITYKEIFVLLERPKRPFISVAFIKTKKNGYLPRKTCCSVNKFFSLDTHDRIQNFQYSELMFHLSSFTSVSFKIKSLWFSFTYSGLQTDRWHFNDIKADMQMVYSPHFKFVYLFVSLCPLTVSVWLLGWTISYLDKCRDTRKISRNYQSERQRAPSQRKDDHTFPSQLTWHSSVVLSICGLLVPAEKLVHSTCMSVF